MKIMNHVKIAPNIEIPIMNGYETLDWLLMTAARKMPSVEIPSANSGTPFAFRRLKIRGA